MPKKATLTLHPDGRVTDQDDRELPEVAEYIGTLQAMTPQP